MIIYKEIKENEFYDKSFLENFADYSQNPKDALNPNHSHFILLNTKPSENEIKYRADLEKELCDEGNNNRIPIVQIVVEGGLGTLETINYSILNKIPVVLIAVSLH